MTEAIEVLTNKVAACQKACNTCFDACLNEDHVQMMAECIRTDRDCADICGIVLSFTQRESRLLPELITACIKACQLCASECGQHDHDHCQACAKVCRECEAACQTYLDSLA